MASPKKKDTDVPHAGTIRCTWCVCPNQMCASRDWPHWHIDYKQDEFWCGTCLTQLQKPMFCIPLNGKKDLR